MFATGTTTWYMGYFQRYLSIGTQTLHNNIGVRLQYFYTFL